MLIVVAVPAPLLSENIEENVLVKWTHHLESEPIKKISELENLKYWEQNQAVSFLLHYNTTLENAWNWTSKPFPWNDLQQIIYLIIREAVCTAAHSQP